MYYTWKKKIKKSCKNNKFRISALTWNEKFELHDGSYSASDIQDYLYQFPAFFQAAFQTDHNPPA